MQASGHLLATMFEGLRVLSSQASQPGKSKNSAKTSLRAVAAVFQNKVLKATKYGTCISVNDEIAHQTPRKDRILKEGDIVKVDVTCNLNGYESDSCTTYPVGKISDADKKLIEVTKKLCILVSIKPF